MCLINHLYTGNSERGTLANSEDPEEMQHSAAFHQDLHFAILWGQKYIIIYKIIPVTLKVHNGQSHTYCINMYGKIQQNTKGLQSNNKCANQPVLLCRQFNTYVDHSLENYGS